MDLLKNIFWLMEQGFQAAVYFWPISAVAAILLPAAVCFDSRSNKEEVKRRAFSICSPLLFPTLIFILGGILKNKPDYDFVPVILLAVTVLLSIFIVLKNKKIWKSALSGNLAIIWVGFIAEFISTMSISNDWL